MRTDSSGVAHEDYYDAAGQVVQRRSVKGSSTLLDQDYAYDQNGNRSKDEKGTEAYNSRDQLVKWTRASGLANPLSTVTYTLTGSGAVQRATDSAGPDTEYTIEGDRLISAKIGGTPSTEYRYDGFGNLTGLHPSAVGDASQDTIYGYDAFSRMTSANTPAQPAATYAYDGFDRRDKQTKSGVETLYGYLGASSDLSQESAPAKTKSYDYDAGGERQELEWLRRAGLTE